MISPAPRSIGVVMPDLDTTGILRDLAAGEPGAADRLLPAVYDELRRLAGRCFRGQAPDHTLQPTALVHEAYLKLVDQTRAGFESRAHFLAVAATAMRHILVDHARRQRAAKRGGGRQRVTLDEGLVADRAATDVDLLRLDEALRGLAALDERKARIVELRFFGGLGIEQTAEALGVARSTVAEDWRTARAWLAAHLGPEEAP